jgi:hypothetical protein
MISFAIFIYLPKEKRKTQQQRGPLKKIENVNYLDLESPLPPLDFFFELAASSYENEARALLNRAFSSSGVSSLNPCDSSRLFVLNAWSFKATVAADRVSGSPTSRLGYAEAASTFRKALETPEKTAALTMSRREIASLDNP